MSIVVQDLVKFYGKHTALDSISFKVEPGKILGLLGPNGAGKSTTMKILSGYLPAASGKVFISGLNIEENSLAARSKIGYLPENNPLYPEMYVVEYLEFVAQIFKVSTPKKALTQVLDQTGLGDVRGKKIGQLSKGYRQRVGLAQALISEPEVLILDEPTSGLDPNQLHHIRSLIQELGKNKTVILSTHIMQEVEILCQEVIILNLGKIVAQDTVSGMVDKNKRVKIFWVDFDQEIELSDFLAIENVLSVKRHNPNLSGHTHPFTYILTASTDKLIREKLFELAVNKSRVLLGLRQEEIDLSQIFQELTRPQS